MNRKVAVLWLCTAMLASSVVIVVEIAPPARADTITVDDSGGADYTTINEALFAASDGDTIYVYSGTYYENVIVDKTLILIGENYETTIINGSWNGDVVAITAPYVNMNGFTITGSGTEEGDAGLLITVLSDNCNISSNKIEKNLDGFRLFSSYNTIMNNNISLNGDEGIYHGSSSGNLIKDNTFMLNNDTGIYVSSSTGNSFVDNHFINNSFGIATWDSIGNEFKSNTFTLSAESGIAIQFNSEANNVTDNIVHDNRIGISLFLSNGNNITGNDVKYNINSGITLQSSDGNYVADNNCSLNEDGFQIQGSNGNNIANNIVMSNDQDGIYLQNSNDNDLLYNAVHSNNNRGIEVYDSDGNNASCNTVSSNTEVGIYLFSSNTNTITCNDVTLNDDGIYSSISSNNRIYHNNIIDNNRQGYDTGNNQWDNGYPSGGNFWSDWTTPDDNSGPNQDEPGSDGIVDEPYVLESPTGRDNYPFTTQNGWTPPPGPVYNRDSDEHFNTIQQAIDDADTLDGHTIEVSAGTYYENVVVDKTITLAGEDRDTTIIDGGGVEDVVRITKDWVNISGFTVRDSGPNGSPRDAGIEVNSAHHVTISDNNFSLNRDAIYLCNSNYSLVTENIVDDFEGIHTERSSNVAITGNILSNDYYGIYLDSSTSIGVADNTMTGDGLRIEGNSHEYWDTHDIGTSNTVNGKPIYYWKNRTSGTVPSDAGQIILASCTSVKIENQEISDCYIGIIMGYSDENTIINNNASSNHDSGMFLFNSHDNLIEGNTFIDNMEAIYFKSSHENTIKGNLLHDNAGGLLLGESDTNMISDNTMSGNLFGVMLILSNDNNISRNSINTNWVGSGIYIAESSDNIITVNTLSDNEYGINITDSQDNMIYHNNFTGNTVQALDSTDSGNQWDNGYPSGGNYWDDYSGADTKNGPNQDISGPDGIGDTPYSIDPDSRDNYPLMQPWGEDSIPPRIELVDPSNNSVERPGIIIDLTITDTNLDQVTYSLNGKPYQTLLSPYDIDTTDWNDGDYRIDVSAVDTAENLKTASFNIIIDSTPPMIILVSPFNGSFVDSNPEIELLISEVNPDAVSYSVNSGTQKLLLEPYVIDGSTWPEGENNVTVHAIDKAGNSIERWFIFIKDSIAPEITLNSPGNASLLLGSTILDFDVLDENLRYVTYSIDQGSFTTLEEPYDLDTTGWDEGEHVVTIQADDATGHVVERWFIFTIDASPPSIESCSITDKAEDVKVDSVIVIEFSEPMDTESVESAIIIDPFIEYNCTWGNDNKSMILEFQNPLEYDTLYNVSIGIGAEDAAGRGLESSFAFEFTTEKGPGGDGDGFPFMVLLVIIIAIAVVIIVSALVISKRKKGPKAMVSPPTGIAQQIQVTCTSCGNLLSLNDIGTTMNVTCPFCSQVMTIESQMAAVQMPQSQAEILPSAMQISCPQCQFIFSIERTGGPTRVQCPNCGVAGTMNP